MDHLADLFWAGFLGPSAVGTVGVAQAWIQVFNAGRMGLDAAARALVSRAVGAGDMPQANHIARQCLIFNLAFALVVMWVGIVLSDVLLRILGVGPSVVEEGSVYQQLRFAASFFFSVGMLAGSLLQAGGDTLTPMKARLLSRAVHILLTPVLMFGWGGLLPPLGVSGGALANGIAQVLSAWINLHALFAGTSRVHLSLDNLDLDARLLVRQVQIGAPAAVTHAERSIAQVVLVGLAAPFGSAGLAVYAVTQRIQMLGALGAHGLAQAGGVIVGQNLGARQPERARATVWWALAITFAIQSLVFLLIVLFPEAVMFIFSRDPEVVDLGATWLRIEALAVLLFGTANVLILAFNTAGDTIVPMVAGLGGLWGVQQPLAIVLTGAVSTWTIAGRNVGLPGLLNLGILGIPWAIVAAGIGRFLFLFLYFLRGPWWKKELLRPA